MEELVASTLDGMISGTEKEVLVEIVRLIQKKGLKGSRGDWKEFLNSYDRKLGASFSDPSKRSVDALATFIKSFNQPKDLKVIGNIFRQQKDQNTLKKHSKESLAEESPLQRLVRLTMEHPLYGKFYFQYYDNKDWVVVPTQYISKAMKPDDMLAIACGMVLCDDGTEEVVEVCVVDKKSKVKLKSLVKPNKPVTDYRTKITGVLAEDLEGVSCSLADIQRSMKNLLSKGTILVGHCVQKDLRALKIVHQRVIDIAFIFKYSEGPPTHIPSLDRLCKAVLGFSVRKKSEPHDCSKKAEAVMKLVIAKLQHGIDDIIDVIGVPGVNPAELLLHKIQIEIPHQELLKVFPRDLNFDMQAGFKNRDKFYSRRAIFKDAREANEAFQRVQGHEKKDSVGRPQKLVNLKLGTGQIASFYLCKMTTSLNPQDGGSALQDVSSDDEGVESLDLKRQRTTTLPPTEADDGRDVKVQRSRFSDKSKNTIQDSNFSGACSPKSCQHSEEIDRLKLVLSARDDEVFKLQKILADIAAGEQ